MGGAKPNKERKQSSGFRWAAFMSMRDMISMISTISVTYSTRCTLIVGVKLNNYSRDGMTISQCHCHRVYVSRENGQVSRSLGKVRACWDQWWSILLSWHKCWFYSDEWWFWWLWSMCVKSEEEKKNVGGFLPSSAKCSANLPGTRIHPFHSINSYFPLNRAQSSQLPTAELLNRWLSRQLARELHR